MTKPTHCPTLTRAIEDLLSTPGTGDAVATEMNRAATERDTRDMIRALRARRARVAYDREVDRLDTRGQALSPGHHAPAQVPLQRPLMN